MLDAEHRLAIQSTVKENAPTLTAPIMKPSLPPLMTYGKTSFEFAAKPHENGTKKAAVFNSGYGKTKFDVTVVFVLLFFLFLKNSIKHEYAKRSIIMSFQNTNKMMKAENLRTTNKLSDALIIYESLAEQNNPTALCIASEMHGKGHGTPINYIKSFDYSRRAAEAGSPYGNYLLAMHLSEGLGVAQDLTIARALHQKAAQTGVPDAQFQFARACELGRGGPQDPTLALKFYRQAVINGHALAIGNLGALYINTNGIEQNYILAFALMRIAGALGMDSPRRNLIQLTLLLTEAQRVEADDIVKAYHNKRALPETTIADGRPQNIPQSETIAELQRMLNLSIALSHGDFSIMNVVLNNLFDGKQANAMTIANTPNDKFWSALELYGLAFRREEKISKEDAGFDLTQLIFSFNHHGREFLLGIRNDAAKLRLASSNTQH